jgi:hypothetical protein
MEQQDVDDAFAEFDRARLLINPHPAPALRDALLCVGCGSDRYTYNSEGTCEAGARVCEFSACPQLENEAEDTITFHTVQNIGGGLLEETIPVSS